MKRMTRTATAGLAVVFLTVPLVSHGTSSSTWHVTVNNTSDVTVVVTVWYSKGTGSSLAIDQDTHIVPGSQHKFNIPGAYCPFGLSGTYQVGGWSWLMNDACCATGRETDVSNCWPACANHTFVVCRQAGTPGDSPRNGDYGFCKQ